MKANELKLEMKRIPLYSVTTRPFIRAGAGEEVVEAMPCQNPRTMWYAGKS